MAVLLLLLVPSASTIPPPLPPLLPPPPLTIGQPAPLLSHQQMVDWKVRWPDAGLYGIKNRRGYQFFMEGGPAGDTPGTPWTVMSSDGLGKGLAVTERVATNIAVQGYPCPDGFPAPCVHLDPDPGSLSVAPCDSSATSQRWNLTADPTTVTSVQSELTGSCWEINGCNGPDVDTNYGCKKLPSGSLPCKGCCNMAWRFNPNGTIVSGMNLRSCLHVDEATKAVSMGACTGARNEVWSVKGQSIESALGGCIDNRPNPAVNASTVGMWVANVYDAGADGILAFIHMEFRVNPTVRLC